MPDLKLPEGIMAPQEIGKVQQSIMGLEQAPSSRQQLGSFANWKQLQDTLGQPFNNERIPITRLKLMRRDPMFGFGMHFTKMPIVRAPWYMHSDADAQVAGFMDAALRSVMSNFIIQHLQKLEFGFQASAKRFQAEIPTGTYRDPESGEPSPVWPGGNVPAITMKKPVSLPPEGVDVIWDEKTGEFNGILYTPPKGGSPAGGQGRAKGKGGSEGQVEIDLYHSLWSTNEIDSVFGNIFGYPRLGYGYPYWWSYWFRWAVADRAFERKGDPQTVVRHPTGDVDLGGGESMPAAEYALLMAERLRAGAGIALPSETYLGLDDKPSNVKLWDIEFLKGGVELDLKDETFQHLEIMKLRSIFVPEQALIEGGGGTSSRNVAKEMYSGLIEAQSLLMEEFVETMNRFVIPHLMIVNWPEKYNAGVKVEMRTRGFTSQDQQILQQLVQVVGQENWAELGVDVREAMAQHGMPMMSEHAYQEKLAQQAALAAASGPPTVEPGVGRSGVVPTPGRAPATEANRNGDGSVLGFSDDGGTSWMYVDAIQQINLSDMDSSDYLASLPASMHYQDNAMKSLSRGLWTAINVFYRDQYKDFAKYLDEYEGDLHLSGDAQKQVEELEFAPSDFIRDFAHRVVQSWSVNFDKLDAVVARTKNLIDRMVKRAGKLTKQEADLEVELSDDDVEPWVEARVADVVADTMKNTRLELEDFVANFIQDEGLDPRELSKAIQAHFKDFPGWKADRYARTETRDAYNAGVLLSGQANGLSVAQAVDARFGKTDGDCEDRDGQFFTLDQAMREDEHPNGTLGWRLVRDPVTLSRVDEMPNGHRNALGYYDPETKVIYLSRSVNGDDERKFLMAIGEKLAVNG